MVRKLPQAFDKTTTLRFHLAFLAALTPAAVQAVVLHGLGAGASVVLTVAAAWLSDLVLRRWGGAPGVQDGAAPLLGLLLALLLPAQAPLYLGPLGAAFAILLIKGLFGGGVTPWINPVLAAWALLQAGWPLAFAASGAAPGPTPFDVQATDWLNSSVFSWFSIQLPQGYLDLLAGWARPEAAPLAESAGLWVLGATVFLLARGYLPWEVPAAFFAAFILPLVFFGQDPLGQVFRGTLLVNLFFLASDPSSRPLSRGGLVVYAGGAGFLAFLVRTWGLAPDGVGYAVLFMNLLVPWIDQRFRRKALNDFRMA